MIYEYYYYVSVALLIVVLTKTLVFIVLSSMQKMEFEETTTVYSSYKPLVSIIVPCFNEEKVIENCLRSLLNQDYENYEIIIVNDGSTDSTNNITKSICKKYSRVSYIAKENGGKASALNRGIEKSNGEIIICIDADSTFLPNTTSQLVLSFLDPQVGAVGGNVRISNKNNLLTLHQALEYIFGLNFQRRSFAKMNAMQVIAGAIGAFRKNALVEIGLYSDDTMVEDMDVTVAINKAHHKVIYNPSAIAYTEAPENLHDFYKQRARWTKGRFKVLQKYKNLLLNKKYGNIGLIGLPYSLIFPFIDIIISFILLFSIYISYISNNFETLLTIFVATTTLQTMLVYWVLRINGEDKKLALLVPFELLFYNHLIALITGLSFISFLFNREESWNKCVRLGKNAAPVLST